MGCLLSSRSFLQSALDKAVKRDTANNMVPVILPDPVNIKTDIRQGFF